jgi:hypothetical protein
MENSSQTSLRVDGEKKPSFFDWANKILSVLPDRSQKIVKKRFGIGQAERETLDRIGKEHSITRERVRQIIADAAKKIADQRDNPEFREAEEKILWTIAENSGIMEEEKIIEELSNGSKKEANAVAFFAAASGKINILEEKGLFKKSWAASADIISKVREIADAAKVIFQEGKQPLNDPEIAGKIIAKKPQFSEMQVLHYLAVIVDIRKNKFGRWGMIEWKEVSPRGTRERIYLILKEQKKPLHFTEVAALIDKYGLGKKKAHPQTVHNELIKDERFVLVGRGIYALKEWGYERGTIKDVLENILRQSQKPMSRDDILKEVLKKRKVKKATVMINLNNPQIFMKVNSGYALKK